MATDARPDSHHIQYIVDMTLGGSVKRIDDLSPGFSGSKVYAVDVVTPTGQLQCIVKLIPDWGNEEDWPNDEQVTNRVYGSRAASFGTSYALLQLHAIPLPQVFLARAPQPDLPYYCYLMERLPGENVETVRARLSGRSLASLDRALGQYLGTIHRITRSYYGWADLQVPPPLSWRDALFTALHTVLDRACIHPVLAQHRQQIVQTFDQYAAAWIDPPRFVFSHGDGLQGMLVQSAGSWILSGVIDIEDHSFTDQRFALAVYEVSMRHAPLRESFWEAYEQHTTLDSTYLQFRPLFQLYVLLDWLGNLPLAQVREIEKLTHQITLRCAARGR